MDRIVPLQALLVGRSILLIALMVHGGPISPCAAQLDQSSIARVPANVDLYIGGYQMGAPWRAFWESRAMMQLQQSQLGTQLVDEFQQAWRERRGSIAPLRSIVENRNMQDSLRFVEDVVSNDFFFAADDSLSDFMQRLSTVLRKSHLLSDPSISNAEKAEWVYGWIDQLGPDWKVPNLILAGSITDKEGALTKIDQMEGLLRFGLGARSEAKPFLKLLKRIEDKRGTRLQWRIPFASIPWDFVPTNEVFDSESLDRLREVLEDKSLVLTFGILDERFIVALGDTTDPMPATSRESSLLEHPDLKGVRDHQDQKITGVRYTSDRLARAIYELGWKDFFSKLANTLLKPMTYELEDSEYLEWLRTCIDDAAWIDSEIESHIPEPRGSTEWSLLVDNGWEVHAHYRTVNPVFTGNGPMRGASHWGTRPLIVLDIKLAEHPEYFATSRSIVRRVKQRLDDLKRVPVRELPEPRWSEFLASVDRVWPTLFQWAQWWQNEVLPNMNGEHALVLQANGLSSLQWHPDMPQANELLPIPEVAILTGIRNRDGWVQTLRGARDLLSRLLGTGQGDKAVELFVPEQILRPVRSDHNGAITFGYPIPESCPAPKSMMPRVQIDGNWSILSYSDSQMLDVSNPSSPSIGNGLFQPSEGIAKGAYVDLGGLSRMLTPWIQYAIDQNPRGFSSQVPFSVFATEFNIDIKPEDITNAWRTLEGLGQMSSVTTIGEDGSSYSRSVFVFGD